MAIIEISGIDVDESIGSGFGGEFTFTITLTEPAADVVTVNYRTIRGTADEAVDYPEEDGTITFGVGEDTKEVKFRARSDNTEERDEAFVFELFQPVGADFPDNLKVLRETAFVLDDDGVALDRAVFVSSPVVLEGDAGQQTVVFDVTLSRASGSSITLDYSTIDGSARAGQDYTATSGQLVFAPGQTTKQVSVTVSGDTAWEASEAFYLAVNAPSGIGEKAGGLVGTAIILDDDSGGGPVMSVIAESTRESIGSGFGGTVTFSVILSEPAFDVVSVGYRSLQGTALEEFDFPDFDGTLNFAPGETVKTIDVRVRSDNTEETDESFAIELFDVTGARFARNEKVLRETVFIFDDDGVGLDRALSVSSPVIVEGNGGQKNAIFKVLLSEPSSQTLTFDYATKQGSALQGEDYVGKSGTLTFAPGQTETYVFVAIKGDKKVEVSEYFHLAVTPTNALGDKSGGVLGTAEILDNDAGGNGPTLNLASENATESIGSGFGGTVNFTLTLSKPSLDSVSVDYRAMTGSAVNEVDFPFDDGTVVFAPGETSKTVDIRVRSDNTTERDEAFVLELSNISGARFEGQVPVLRETVFIYDDDGANLDRAIYVSNPVIREGQGGERLAVFDIELSRPAEVDFELDYRTAPGSAKGGEDFKGEIGVLFFSAGQTKASVEIPVLGDRKIEPTEQFFLVVESSSVFGNDATGAVGTATLLDNDAGGPRPTISIDATNAQESIGSGFGGVAQLGLTLSFAATEAITVEYRTVGGTATESVDFPSASGLVTFAPGETFQTVDLRVTSDNTTETDEAFSFEVFDPIGASLADGAERLVTSAFIFDDDGVNLDRTLFVNDVFVTEGNDAKKFATFEVMVSEAFQDTTTIAFETLDGSAEAGKDYFMRSGNVVFNPGQTSAFVNVGLIPNFSPESTEDFSLVLKNLPPNVVNLPGSTAGTATIADNDIGGNGLSNTLFGTRFSEGIWGFAGAERLDGKGGNDRIFGGDGNDRLFGGNGFDNLFGGRGNDRMFGGNGQDLLVGNKGKDTMTGLGGADEFRFNTGDSNPGPAGRDVITDFTRSQGDKINLKGIDGKAGVNGNQTLDFIGLDEEFTAAGQVRYNTSLKALEINRDNDDFVEMRIILQGVDAVIESDLIL